MVKCNKKSVFGLLALAFAAVAISGSVFFAPLWQANYKPVSLGAISMDDLMRLELNTASKEQLISLPGLGEKKATAIITYRQQENFSSVEQLLQIKGITQKDLEAWKEYLYIK